MTPEERQKQSHDALLAFAARVKELGLWNGAWLGMVAIRRNAGWQVYMLRVHLTASGFELPDVVDATTSNVIVRAFKIDLENLWRVLAGVVCGDLAELNKLAGVTVEVPVGKNPNVWSATTNTYASGHHRVGLSLSTVLNLAFSDAFGFELFDRLAPQLQAHEPPYASLHQIATSMRFSHSANFDGNGANPRFEVGAELPLGPVKARYSAAQKGIEISFPAGQDVALDRISVTIVGSGLRERRAGDEFASSSDPGGRKFSLHVPCLEPTADVHVHLNYADAAVSRDTVEPQPAGGPFAALLEPADPTDEWATELEVEHHVSRKELRRQLNAILPKRAAEVVESRVRSAILLRKDHPFFSVASAGSVAELLVKESLALVTKRTRNKHWRELKAAGEPLPKKLPADDWLKFDHAIKLAEKLGELDDIDASSIDLLREARNRIHLSRKSIPPKADFSPARAAGAIEATLRLCRKVATACRKRR
jgi:hypothetical protein